MEQCSNSKKLQNKVAQMISTASAVTTILAFMPMAILPGPSGDFMGSIAISVMVMLGSSLFLALTITPVLAAWLLPRGLDADRHWWVLGIDSGRMGTALTRALDWSLRQPLAAIALVFAIFELNPAPFCLLDEVDAPLDDINAVRFSELVKDMSDRVQFLFVTHNKITMEIAEQLIGVTMHEPGVSRLVAVDVDEAVEMVAV